MAWDRPSLEKLIRRAESDIETKLPTVDAFLRRSVENVLAKIQAGAAHSLHGHLQWLSRQLLVDQAEVSFLERHASKYGSAYTRDEATFATGDIVLTGTNGSTAPAGTKWQTSDGVEYEQDALATIAGGTATVAVTAVEAGDDGNLDAAQLVSLVSPISGIDDTATVDTGGIIGGADEETDAALRARLLARIRNPPKGGGPGDYVIWAQEVDGVTRAWQYANYSGIGTVAVFFVRDNDTPIIPSAGEIAEVQTYIDARAPVLADVTVYAPTGIAFDVTASVTPDTAAVRAAVEAEIEDLLYREGEPAGTIYLSQLNEAFSIAQDETDHTITLPAADVTHAAGEIPIMGTVTWV